jgi:hypothetical protein
VHRLIVGGVLLWRRRPWGLVVDALASVQGALYLLVLTVNSVLAVARGLAPAAGQLPLWGPLTLTTATAAALLLVRIVDGRGGPRRVRGAPHGADLARTR